MIAESFRPLDAQIRNDRLQRIGTARVYHNVGAIR
jgi:hypothetical protein